MFSPDGKWLAYAKGTTAGGNDSDRGVFVQPFPATGAIYPAPRQVVDFHPTWSSAGNELVYTAGAAVGQMVALPVALARGVTFGRAVLFPASVGDNRLSSEHRAWDMLPDGHLLGVIAGTDEADRSSSTEIRVILNWFEALKQHVPVE